MSDSGTPWTVARQAPLSMEFSRNSSICVSYKLNIYDSPSSSKSVGIIFPTASVSHFGNSHSILNFHTIIVFVMVVSDF